MLHCYFRFDGYLSVRNYNVRLIEIPLSSPHLSLNRLNDFDKQLVRFTLLKCLVLMGEFIQVASMTLRVM